MMMNQERKIFLGVITTLILLFFLSYSPSVSSHQSPSAISFAFESALNAIKDARFRIARLNVTERLGPIDMWVAMPHSETIVPGTNWYAPIWDSHTFPSFGPSEDMMALSPCVNYDKIFLQVGAHLGIYPLSAAYRKCMGIAVEGMPLAANFSRFSAALNGWDTNQFLSINSAVSDHNGFVLFDPMSISISASDSHTSGDGKVRVPLITLDTLNTKYGLDPNTGKSRIAFVVIDVEGHEQEVLLGAKDLIASEAVIVYNIEIWTERPGIGVIEDFYGLQLLIDHGYRIFSSNCVEFTDRLDELPTYINQTYRCWSQLPPSTCLGELYATSRSAPPWRCGN